MKKIVAIVLISFVGFLGCSDGDDGTTTVGEASQVAPWAIIETPTPSYEWTPVAEATKYRLLVYDTNETAIIEEWYTAEEAGCASKGGLCIVEPDVEVIGENAWKVLACVNEECGSWSGPMNFDFCGHCGTAEGRFVVQTAEHGAEVIDNNTKLMWFIDPGRVGFLDNTYSEAVQMCEGLKYPHDDWRMPTLTELRSLVDDHLRDPALVSPNPFVNVQLSSYWTAPVFALAVCTSSLTPPAGSIPYYCYRYTYLIITMADGIIRVAVPSRVVAPQPGQETFLPPEPPVDMRNHVWCVRDPTVGGP